MQDTLLLACLNPSLQLHLKDPSVFSHTALLAHTCHVCSRHILLRNVYIHQCSNIPLTTDHSTSNNYPIKTSTIIQISHDFYLNQVGTKIILIIYPHKISISFKSFYNNMYHKDLFSTSSQIQALHTYPSIIRFTLINILTLPLSIKPEALWTLTNVTTLSVGAYLVALTLVCSFDTLIYICGGYE